MAALFLAVLLLTAPVEAAERVSEEHVDVTEAVVETDDGSTVVHLEYTTGLAVKIDTLLFGSKSLEESLAAVVGVENPKYTSLTTESATLVVNESLNGDHEFGQTVERIEVRDDDWRVYHDADSVYLG